MKNPNTPSILPDAPQALPDAPSRSQTPSRTPERSQPFPGAPRIQNSYRKFIFIMKLMMKIANILKFSQK